MGNCYKSNFTQAANYDQDTTPKRTFAGQKRFAKVVKVYDGDTISIITKLDKNEQPKKYNLRLSGIDAPEKKIGRNAYNPDLYIKAANHVTNLLLHKIGGIGSVIYVEFDKEEKYGRLMGQIWRVEPTCCGFNVRKTININKWLLDKSLVIKYDGSTKIQFSNQHLREILQFRDLF